MGFEVSSDVSAVEQDNVARLQFSAALLVLLDLDGGDFGGGWPLTARG